ncbi:hypothetical protein QBC44DRAFT_324234 [Cladorrhinum sp. PSN332]|nr:hypothetical protein QBC44DRAFT_324234 [Cladorrhinum sp. PSN332]
MVKKQVGINPPKMEPTRAYSPENIYGTMVTKPDPDSHHHLDSPSTTNTEGDPAEQPNEPSSLRPPICLLVLGPAGSGKSTFIAKLLGRPSSDPMIGHNTIDSHTTTITHYSITHAKSDITILDTPALTPDTFLPFLSLLATHLQSSQQSIDGLILTHPITLNRLTNSTRQCLQLIKSICGPEFFSSRALLLTTMWDQAAKGGGGGGGGPGPNEVLVKREAQLLASPNFWGSTSGGASPNGSSSSGKHVRFDGAAAPDAGENEVLDHFLNIAGGEDDLNVPQTQMQMQFEKEVTSGIDVKETTAGRLVLGEQEERKKKVEAELIKMKDAEEEKLKRERSKLFRSGRRRAGSSHGVVAGRATVEPYSQVDHMAYPDPTEETSGEGSQSWSFSLRTSSWNEIKTVAEKKLRSFF